MENKTNRGERYDRPHSKKTRDVDKRVIQQGNEVFAAIQMVFQFASFPIQSPMFIIDPYQAAPLSAIAGVKTPTPTQITVTVAGKNGSNGDISHTFPGYSTAHLIPVLGLYPGYDNQVTLQVTDESGNSQSTVITAATEPLEDEDFGALEIIVPAQAGKLQKNDLYITCMQGAYPTATDLEGEVRWLIKEHYDEGLPTNIFGPGPFYLLNAGRLFFRHTGHYAIGGIDPLGRIYRLIDTDFAVHHDVTQMPDENLLIQSAIPDRDTIEDTLTVMNFDTEEILKTVDYMEILDPSLPPQPDFPTATGKLDWLHANSIEYDVEHNVYITSSRHQNVVVATDMDTNEIRWMLGSPTRWPERFQQYFLTPVGADGNPLYNFSNPGDVAAADHDFWNWAQHSAKIFTNDGNPDTVEIMLFDNGPFRSYDPEHWIVPYENWSRAQYFRINTANMTVRLLWEFGRDLGSEYYSGYVGNVQYIEETNSMYISFGGTNMDLDTGRNVGQQGDVPMEDFPPEYYDTARIQEKTRVIEVSMDTGEILFAFDRYNPGVYGIVTSNQYKGYKADLYDFPMET